MPAAPRDPRLLVGVEAGDDAAVYRVCDHVALIHTVDFFTPVVDDPSAFGAIAAANALSDVYAMGGEPRTALSILCAQPDELPPGTLAEMARGAGAKLAEAGCLLVGGHSVRDPELKFGFAVTGVVDPARVVTARGARPGDVLLLTKPLGTGILSTALKNACLSAAHARTLTESLLRLNKVAGRALGASGATAATDVTGFALAGHALNMAGGVDGPRDITLRFVAKALPLLPGVEKASRTGFHPGGLSTNREYYGPHVHIDPRVPAWKAAVVFDPQTSGGILAAVPPRRVAGFVKRCAAGGVKAVEVGVVEASGAAPVVVG